MLTIADQNNGLTTYSYDAFDRLAKIQYPSPTTAGTSSTTDYEAYSYDDGSNLTSRRLRDGNTIGYSYDKLNRPIGKTFVNAGNNANAIFGYDNVGHLTSATNGNSAFTSAFYLSYDALGRKVGEQQFYNGGGIGAKTIQYDAAGRRTRLTWGDGFYVAYDYDTLGEMTAVRENGAVSGIGVLATLAYDDLGRRTGITRGNGTTTALGYNAISQLTSLAQNLAGTASDESRTFAYNPASQITSRTSSNDGYAWTQPVNTNRNYSVNRLNQYTLFEPPRVCRRLFGLSYAAMRSSSSMA